MLLLPGVLSLWDGILSSPNSESNSILSFLTLSIILYIQYDLIYKKLISVRLSLCLSKHFVIFMQIEIHKRITFFIILPKKSTKKFSYIKPEINIVSKNLLYENEINIFFLTTLTTKL